MKVAILIILITFFVQQTLTTRASGKTESPKYIILKKFETLEIRQYPDLILATTTMGPKYSENSGNGFRTVAGYIFGGNDTNEKISMTSPVMVEMSDTIKMSFVMPSKYAIDDLPDPDNPAVHLHEEGSKILAIIRYDGFSNETKMEENRLKLYNELQKNNLTPIGSYMFFGYNPPYQLFNRKNEIAVEIIWDDELSDVQVN